MRIIVSGGGTGGHIYPAITIARAIKELEPQAQFLYVGTKKGLEADIVPKEGMDFAAIDVAGLKRSLSPVNFFRLLRAARGVAEAKSIVQRFRPHLVIGTGGYVAGPVLLAASLAHIPTLIQEQNVVPGVTNKILARFVKRIAVGMEGALNRFPKRKTVLTGNPIRNEVMTASARDGYQCFGFSAEKPTVLVTGGSRGARAINRAMIGVLKLAAHHDDLQYLLSTGKAEYEDTKQRLEAAGVQLDQLRHIRVVPYLYDMPSALAMADLVISRAGATGIAELTARGVPAILIPYPYAAENHQEKNARALEKAGAARVILNKDLTAESLTALLIELMTEDTKLVKMRQASRAMGRPTAARDIAHLALSLVQ